MNKINKMKGYILLSTMTLGLIAPILQSTNILTASADTADTTTTQSKDTSAKDVVTLKANEHVSGKNVGKVTNKAEVKEALLKQTDLQDEKFASDYLKAQDNTFGATQAYAKAKAQVSSKKVRVMVQLDAKPAIAKADTPEADGSKAAVKAIDAATDEVIDDQSALQDKVEKITGHKVAKEFGYLWNGFSIDAKQSEIAEIQKIDGVKLVQESDLLYPQDTDANVLAGVTTEWQSKHKLKGEGLLIADIDSGIDASHKDMRLTEAGEKAAKMSEADANSAISALGYGKYETEKVPYAMNYADHSTNPEDLYDATGITHEHGMHVAGIMAANGKDADNMTSVQGVAPEAQLLNMKVFSNENAGASTDTVIDAIEDSVKLGADILNLSLGSDNGTVDATSAEQVALTNAAKKGILPVVAAGNAGRYDSKGGNDMTATDSIEDQTLNSPGVTAAALTVASYENTTTTTTTMKIKSGDKTLLDDDQAIQTNSTTDYSFPDEFFTDQQSFYLMPDGGTAQPDADLPGYATTDNIALIPFNQGDYASQKKILVVSRGMIGFTDMQAAAIARNVKAKGLIIIDNVKDETPQFKLDASLPTIALGYSQGTKLVKAIRENSDLTATFSKIAVKKIANPNAQKLSSFSSWGPTPNLDLKPEVSAPGGNIWSTANDNGYQNLSGTSMATPFVAGSAALIMQNLKANAKNLATGTLDYVQAIKNVITNTSKPVVDKAAKTIISPRKQGAGLIQVDKAVDNSVILTDKADGDGIFALKEIGETTSFTVKLQNTSNKKVKYSFDNYGGAYTEIQTEDQSSLTEQPTVNGIYTNAETINYVQTPGHVRQYESKVSDELIAGATVKADKNDITLNAGQTKEIKVTLKLSADAAKQNWVEGYVGFTAKTANTPDLVAPYLAFHGNYGAEDMLDKPVDEEGSRFGYGYLTDEYNGRPLGASETGMLDADGNYLYKINRDNAAISPNDDNRQEEAFPMYVAARSVKHVETDIVDADKKLVRHIGSSNGANKEIFGMYEDTLWDGRTRNLTTGQEDAVPDGQYYYKTEVTGELASEKQTYYYPVKVDTKGPEIKNAKLTQDAEGNAYLDAEITDDNSGMRDMNTPIIVVINGHQEFYYVGEDIKVVSDLAHLHVKLSWGQEAEVKNGDNDVYVGADDYAGNGSAIHVAAADSKLKAVGDDVTQDGGRADGKVAFSSLEIFKSPRTGLYSSNPFKSSSQYVRYDEATNTYELNVIGSYYKEFQIYSTNEAGTKTDPITVHPAEKDGAFSVWVPLLPGDSNMHFETADGQEVMDTLPFTFKVNSAFTFDRNSSFEGLEVTSYAPGVNNIYSPDNAQHGVSKIVVSHDQKSIHLKGNAKDQDGVKCGIFGYGTTVSNGVSKTVDGKIDANGDFDIDVDLSLLSMTGKVRLSLFSYLNDATMDAGYTKSTDDTIFVTQRDADGNLPPVEEEESTTGKANVIEPVRFSTHLLQTAGTLKDNPDYDADKQTLVLRGSVYKTVKALRFYLNGTSRDDDAVKVKINDDGTFEYTVKNVTPLYAKTFKVETDVEQSDGTMLMKSELTRLIVDAALPDLKFDAKDNWVYDDAKAQYDVYTTDSKFDLSGSVYNDLRGTAVYINGENVFTDITLDTIAHGNEYLENTPKTFKASYDLNKDSDNIFKVIAAAASENQTEINIVVHQKTTKLDAPKIDLSTTEKHAKSVTLTSAMDANTTVQYSTNKGKTWLPLNDAGLILIANATVQFRATNLWHQTSDVVSVKVDNIDNSNSGTPKPKLPPVKCPTPKEIVDATQKAKMIFSKAL
ncbi:MAG: S8 family serine peptidase [Lactobacillaceae bacterium]|jgi:lactocepin|nr:S8 family serine peptidase [Lactobacillaceae bacterium]